MFSDLLSVVETPHPCSMCTNAVHDGYASAKQRVSTTSICIPFIRSVLTYCWSQCHSTSRVHAALFHDGYTRAVSQSPCITFVVELIYLLPQSSLSYHSMANTGHPNEAARTSPLLLSFNSLTLTSSSPLIHLLDNFTTNRHLASKYAVSMR